VFFQNTLASIASAKNQAAGRGAAGIPSTVAASDSAYDWPTCSPLPTWTSMSARVQIVSAFVVLEKLSSASARRASETCGFVVNHVQTLRRRACESICRPAADWPANPSPPPLAPPHHPLSSPCCVASLRVWTLCCPTFWSQRFWGDWSSFGSWHLLSGVLILASFCCHYARLSLSPCHSSLAVHQLRRPTPIPARGLQSFLRSPAPILPTLRPRNPANFLPVYPPIRRMTHPRLQ
jgi:hypothetical protein